jgi:hypothetical protein
MAGREGDRVGNGWASPRPRARRGAQVGGVQMAYAEKDLQAAARAAGATWDAGARLWRMQEKVARALRLADRIRNGK